MKINYIISQHRRDFTALLECESCGSHEELNDGYDDDNYHRNVIPAMKCKKCGQVAPPSYRAMKTKYEQHEVV